MMHEQRHPGLSLSPRAGPHQQSSPTRQRVRSPHQQHPSLIRHHPLQRPVYGRSTSPVDRSIPLSRAGLSVAARDGSSVAARDGSSAAAAFDRLDVNDDGVIDRAEWMAACAVQNDVAVANDTPPLAARTRPSKSVQQKRANKLVDSDKVSFPQHIKRVFVHFANYEQPAGRRRKVAMDLAGHAAAF